MEEPTTIFLGKGEVQLQEKSLQKARLAFSRKPNEVPSEKLQLVNLGKQVQKKMIPKSCKKDLICICNFFSQQSFKSLSVNVWKLLKREKLFRVFRRTDTSIVKKPVTKVFRVSFPVRKTFFSFLNEHLEWCLKNYDQQRFLKLIAVNQVLRCFPTYVSLQAVYVSAETNAPKRLIQSEGRKYYTRNAHFPFHSFYENWNNITNIEFGV